MALNSAENIVANSGSGYIAPLATALPTSFDEVLSTPWVELGYFSENGATMTVGRETTSLGAWQSRSPLRRSITAENVSFAFEMEQWNPDTMALALGGGTWDDDTTTGREFIPAGADEGITSWAFVLDFEDEAGTFRFAAAKVEIEGDVTIALQREQFALLPVTLTVLETGTDDLYHFLSDAAQFAATS